MCLDAVIFIRHFADTMDSTDSEFTVVKTRRMIVNEKQREKSRIEYEEQRRKWREYRQKRIEESARQVAIEETEWSEYINGIEDASRFGEILAKLMQNGKFTVKELLALEE